MNNLGIQTYQILTNDDEVCILLAVHEVDFEKLVSRENSFCPNVTDIMRACMGPIFGFI